MFPGRHAAELGPRRRREEEADHPQVVEQVAGSDRTARLPADAGNGGSVAHDGQGRVGPDPGVDVINFFFWDTCIPGKCVTAFVLGK